MRADIYKMVKLIKSYLIYIYILGAEKVEEKEKKVMDLKGRPN